MIFSCTSFLNECCGRIITGKIYYCNQGRQMSTAALQARDCEVVLHTCYIALIRTVISENVCILARLYLHLSGSGTCIGICCSLSVCICTSMRVVKTASIRKSGIAKHTYATRIYTSGFFKFVRIY